MSFFKFHISFPFQGRNTLLPEDFAAKLSATFVPDSSSLFDSSVLTETAASAAEAIVADDTTGDPEDVHTDSKDDTVDPNDEVIITADVTAAPNDVTDGRQLRLALPPFSPCLRNGDCSSGRCRRLGIGVCVRSCRGCSEGRYCSRSGCQDRKLFAQPCERDVECLSGICRPGQEDGEGACGCDTDGDCQGTEYCDTNGACELSPEGSGLGPGEAKKAYAESCEEDAECLSSICINVIGCGCRVGTDDCGVGVICESDGYCD